MFGSFWRAKAFVALVALCTQAAALPAPEKRQGIALLTITQIAAFRPYTHYASTGYCSPKSTLAWNCGANCDANPQFVPVASGGDGVITQFWYVGFDPKLDEVIVGHQGTDQDKIVPLLTDGDIIFDPLDKKLFPGLPSSIKVHSGFSGSQARSASGVLAAVKTALAKFGTKKVTVTGHSLGGAIGLIDALFLHIQNPGITTRFVGYGSPRVGNQEWADYIDSLPISVTRINNKEDIVPILPGRFLGYHHASGEVHIQESGAWLACPGQDNTDARCTIGTVPNIFEGEPNDHDGPYDGIETGCDQ
ncbi:lipase [Fomes fomentarius]|nr:lipase [Fomes fomentarius]KAI0788163.1 lipase [Fomes fomentarius]